MPSTRHLLSALCALPALLLAALAGLHELAALQAWRLRERLDARAGWAGAWRRGARR